jgi:tetratricopeptide (TPR) repeat protein
MDDSIEKIRTLYQKGLLASQSRNWDYAIALFYAVLEIAPDNAPARTNLRLAEFQKFDTIKFKFLAKIASRIFKIFPLIKAKMLWHKKNWVGVMQELEKPLRVYPKNINILKWLAESAEKAELLETVCGIYETMYILKPGDITILKKLGKNYHALKQMDKARTYYEKAVAIAPMDYEARKGMQDLAALGTIEKGWEEKGTYRNKIKDEKQADIFEKEARLIRTNEETQILIKDLEQKLAAEPNNIPLIKKLADLYLSIEDYDKALSLYDSIKISDPEIRKEIFNIKMAKLKDSPELLKKLMFEDTKLRVKEFPAHLPLRYEMGTVYMENGMLNEAIGEFQQSVKDPKHKTLSLNNLGVCFYKRGIYDLAINQFQKAINELYEWDELKKDVVYNLGIVYEAMGSKEKAVTEFKKIYEQDIHYKDISKRIS